MRYSITLVLFLFSLHCLHAQCFEDRHSTNIHESWLSCQTSENPNTAKPNSHWILYDLGEPTELYKSTIWNLNYPSRLDNGVQSISVDYSLDGQTWLSLADFELEQAPGSSFYEGEEGPDFDGLSTQFILITANANFGGDCFGLSEIRFYTESDEPVTAIEENINLLNLSVQPNPFNEYFTFNSSEQIQLIIIYDAAGKLIKSINQPNQNEAIVIDFLKSGNYFLNFVSEKGNQVKRVVKF